MTAKVAKPSKAKRKKSKRKKSKPAKQPEQDLPMADGRTETSELTVQPLHTSYTQLSQFQRCKTSYYWKYGLGLKLMAPSVPLLKGSLLHQAYDKYMFEERANHDIAHKEIDRLTQLEIDKSEREGDLSVLNMIADEAHEVMSHYLPWADDNDDWTVVIPPKATKCEISGTIDIEIPRPGQDPLLKPFVFKIDSLVERNGQLMMLENKFRKNLDGSGLEHDLQILAYQAAWNRLHPQHKIQGVIYNIVASKPRKSDGAVGTREYFYRGETEELVALNLIRAIMQEMRAQEELGVWPMSIRKECSWDCDYVGVCLGVRAGGTIQEYVDTGEYKVNNR